MTSSSWISSYCDFGNWICGGTSLDLLDLKSGNPDEGVIRCGGFFPHGFVGGMMISLQLIELVSQREDMSE